MLYGIHALDAALRNSARNLEKLYLTENAERRLAEAIASRAHAPPIERVRPKDLDRKLGPDTVHQGAAADTAPLPEVPLETLMDTGADDRPVLILDQITDPHNVGAILRSAAAFGARALILTRRHSPPLGGALAKSASGALETVPIVLVQNLGDAMQELAGAGMRLVGLDGNGETALDEASLAGPVALVLGAEGKGLRQRSRELCSIICRIETPGSLASLNVSNAAAVALHLAALQRKHSGRSTSG